MAAAGPLPYVQHRIIVNKMCSLNKTFPSFLPCYVWIKTYSIRMNTPCTYIVELSPVPQYPKKQEPMQPFRGWWMSLGTQIISKHRGPVMG